MGTLTEERFIDGDLTKELFEKYQSKFEEEKAELEQKLANQHFDSSNLEKIIDKGMSIAQNISEMWVCGDYGNKQQLQNLVFPEGIVYNKQKDSVRTVRVNSLFEPISRLISFLAGNEKSHLFEDGSKSHLVARTRFELVSPP